MIVKNEETVLSRALSSIQEIADEIIIVDTGSTDNTKKIALNYTDKVYDFQWCDDFSKARNYSFSKATCQYCMWLDADDILLEEDKQKMLHLKKTLSLDTSVVMMKYNTSFDKNGKPDFTYYRERLLRRCDGFQWESFIHEVISPRGKVEYSDIAITHKKEKVGDSNRNLKIYQNHLNRGVQLSPREMYYYARELYYHKEYNLAITQFIKFLDMPLAWTENKISACQFIAYCYSELDDQHKAIVSLFNSFCFDTPRAEICCDLGKYFFEMKNYYQAIYWYKIASKTPRSDNNGAFIQPDCYDFLPYLQLCLCYFQLGDIEKSYYYNELAGKVKPLHDSYIYNRKFFSECPQLQSHFQTQS